MAATGAGPIYSAALEHTSNGRSARYEIRVLPGQSATAQVMARWGRIGSKLQSRVLLDHAEPSRAIQFAQAKVAEKIGGGYNHVAPPSAPPVHAANAAPTSVPKPKASQGAAAIMALALPSVDVSI